MRATRNSTTSWSAKWRRVRQAGGDRLPDRLRRHDGGAAEPAHTAGPRRGRQLVARLPHGGGPFEPRHLLVDEAHSIGVYGEHGRGVCKHFGLTDEVDLIGETFSKSLARWVGLLPGTDMSSYTSSTCAAGAFSARPCLRS